MAWVGLDLRLAWLGLRGSWRASGRVGVVWGGSCGTHFGVYVLVREHGRTCCAWCTVEHQMSRQVMADELAEHSDSEAVAPGATTPQEVCASAFTSTLHALIASTPPVPGSRAGGHGCSTCPGGVVRVRVVMCWGDKA